MTKPPYDFVAATFHFFQVVARRPMAAFWIWLWQMLLVCALVAGFLAAFWPMVMMAVETDMTDEALILQTVLQSTGWFSLLTILAILLSLAAQGAWLRLLTRDEIRPVIPFHLGADELRLFGVNFVFLAFAMLAYLVCAIAFLGGAGLLGLMDGTGGIAVGALIGTVAVLILVVVGIVFCLRFAAAPALSVLSRRFRLFSAVPASKGIAGMMFLSYLVLIGVGIAGSMTLWVIQQVGVLFAASDLVATFTALGEVGNNAEPAEVFAILGEALTSPAGMAVIAFIVVTQFAFQIAFEGLWHGVGAYVARRHDAAQAVSASPAATPVPAAEPSAG